MSGPRAHVSAYGSTSFAATVTELQGAPDTTLQLETRARGSADDWTEQDSAAAAVGAVLTASGLTENEDLEWRVTETDGSTLYDGSHGFTTPASAIWATLTGTVSTALQGQGMPEADIYVGLQPDANYDQTIAILRTKPEKVDGPATNGSERLAFPVEVEFRYRSQDATGAARKVEVEKWQRRLEATLHQKYARDFPGIPGLEQTRVEVATKDDSRPGIDEHQEETRARATVYFAIWRAK